MRVKWDTLKLIGDDKVEVYRNLRRRCWSIRSNKTGKVIDHMSSVVLEDCELVVRQAGREKVRREGVKNVHAFVKGYMVTEQTFNLTTDTNTKDQTMITYNPYQNESFVKLRTEEPISKAKYVQLTDKGYAFAKGVK